MAFLSERKNQGGRRYQRNSLVGSKTTGRAIFTGGNRMQLGGRNSENAGCPPEVEVRTIEAKSILTKSNLPVADYSVNPYVGCAHACKYCYASFMKRFAGHTEPWGEFVDAKEWPWAFPG